MELIESEKETVISVLYCALCAVLCCAVKAHIFHKFYQIKRVSVRMCVHIFCLRYSFQLAIHQILFMPEYLWYDAVMHFLYGLL